MHSEVLSSKQKVLLSLVKKFSPRFGLVGGTAIAVQIGHRRSIDFDLFTVGEFDGNEIREIIRDGYKIQNTLVENPNELTVVVSKVKMTLYKYPFRIEFSEQFEDIIKMPDLLTLSAMKAFALGKRAKWKDYVDLFFIFKKYSFLDVTKKTKEVFGGEFNEKLFREQIAYFEDIDYTETIDYLPGLEVSDETIKERLREISLEK